MPIRFICARKKARRCVGRIGIIGRNSFKDHVNQGGKMRMKIDEVKSLLAAAASKYVPDEHAIYFADLFVETHLRKAPRMNPIQEAVEELQVWSEQTDKSVETVVDKESVVVLNFNGLAPSLKVKQIHDELERRARKNGIAALGFHNSAGVTTLNMWSQGLAKRDLIGISMFNGGTRCCVPYGGRRGVMGTNPLAYSIPTASDPIILDMATTEIPYFEVKNAKDKGQPLRPNVALDPQGNPTTDARAALSDDDVANLLPFGAGFKGYGIVMLVEILTGTLVHSLLSTQQKPGWNPTECGCLIIALDIGSFVEPSHFKQSVSKMCEELRSLDPADGFDAVAVPGDRGHARQRQALATGEIEVQDDVIEKLRQLAH
jgi:LDH2 family malate/lactate/ureidoglycolate dehydrogenase